MTINRIKTDQDDEATPMRIGANFDVTPVAPKGDKLERLTLLVERYEYAIYPIDLPDPVPAIRFCMWQRCSERQERPVRQ